MSQTHVIDGVTLHLAHPDDISMKWVGNTAVRDQLLAAWLVVEKEDTPLSPRLLGKPGVGKTTLAYSVARESGREVYIMQCTMDTRPEDLIITPVIAGQGQIAYHASPLVTAMLRGGTCILDEGNRMTEKSWASLAPLLDRRRYVESVVAGLKIPAHSDFRICVTMNDDASTYEIPEYIQSRLQPRIEVGFPNREEEVMILKFNVPFAEGKILTYVADFLQKAHGQELPFTSRDGVNILRYAIKLGALHEGPPEGYLADAIEAVLGREGADFFDSGIPSSRLAGALREVGAEQENDQLEAFEEFEDFFDEDDDDEGGEDSSDDFPTFGRD